MLRSIARAALLGSALGLGGLLASPAVQAPAAAATPDQFGQRTSVHDAAISPDGSQLALIQMYEGRYIVRILDLDNPGGGKIRAAELDPEAKPKYIKWVNDERVVVSMWQSEKMRREVWTSSFLYTMDTNTMKGRFLVRPKDGFRQFNDRVLDWLEDDPDYIIMEFNESQDEQSYPDVLKVNVANGRTSMIKRQSNRINSWLTDSKGEPRMGIGSRAQGRDSYMTVLDPSTGNWTDADKFPGLDPEEQYYVAITDGGRSVIVSDYRGKNTRGLHRYDLVNKRWAETLYENPEYDVSSVVLSKDGETVVGARFTGEAEERVLFDSYGSTYEEALAQLDGYQVDFVDQNGDGDVLILRVSAPYNPGGLYLYRRGGKLQKISDNMPGLDADKMGEVLSVAYKSRDGQRIPAYVTIPATLGAGQSPKNMPFIVFPHGGPFARDVKRFDYMAQFFAAQGYGVLQMNFRGSEGYGKEFSEAGRSNWVVMQDDVEDGMRWLVDKGYADPDRTCIAGWSYGGYAALMGAAKDPDLYKCAVAIAPLTDIPGAIDDLKGYTNGKVIAENTFGNFMDDKALMRENNPVDRADDITVPVFMAHGTRDTSVEIDQFDTMRKRLEKAGVRGTYLRFDDEDHYMSNQANRQKMLRELARFLKSVNGTSSYAVGEAGQ